MTSWRVDLTWRELHGPTKERLDYAQPFFFETEAQARDALARIGRRSPNEFALDVDVAGPFQLDESGFWVDTGRPPAPDRAGMARLLSELRGVGREAQPCKNQGTEGGPPV